MKTAQHVLDRLFPKQNNVVDKKSVPIWIPLCPRKWSEIIATIQIILNISKVELRVLSILVDLRF